MQKTKQTKRITPASCGTLIDAIPQWVWVKRSDGLPDYTNQRVRDYTGLTKKQIQSDRWAHLQFIHPDDQDGNRMHWEYALDTGTMFEYEERLRNGQTGAYRWFLTHTEPLRNEAGQIVTWFGTATDIDKQKRAEQQLKVNWENWRVLAETVPQLVWTTQPDGHVDYCNQRFCDLTQANFEQLRGYGWRQFLHPEDTERVLTFRHYSLATGELYETEYRLKDGQTGEYRWFLARGTPIRDEAGQIIKWVGTNTDIEEQKRIEDGLREGQERADALMQSKIIGILITEGEQIEDANETFLRMTGYSQEDVREKHMSILQMTPPEYMARTLQALQELGTQQSMTPYEKEYVCQDGSRLPVLVCGVVFHHHPLQAINFVLDNSARKELEQRKDDFINMASHELRTPLTVVKLQTQLVHKRLEKHSQHEAATALSRVEMPIKQLERLIGELLDVSQMQTGRLKYVRERVDLDELLREAADTMQRISPSHTVVVHGSVQTSVTGDRDRLRQVFTNLLSNAIKYSSNAKTVEVELSATEEAVTIRVQDHGMGIPREQHKKIFERFYRATGLSHETIPGLGMGLYIVAEIVKGHGGTITVESNVGKGSTFTVTLPRRRDA